MASVADEIVASPYAIIGSIGVVATIPNFSERLTREGITVEEVTAGQYKRTLTPYSKPNYADREKVRQELLAIHDAFKNSIKKNRPNLNLNAVTTGETWLATDALKHGLVDRIGTFDELMVSEMRHGHALLEIQYDPARNRKRSPFSFAEDASLGAIVAWASRVLLKELCYGSNGASSGASSGIDIGGVVGASSTPALSDPVRQVMMIACNERSIAGVDGLTGSSSSGLPYTPMMYAGNVHWLATSSSQTVRQQQVEQEE